MLGGCSSQCKAGPSVGGGAASGVLGTLSGWSGGPSGSKYDIFWFPLYISCQSTFPLSQYAVSFSVDAHNLVL